MMFFGARTRQGGSSSLDDQATFYGTFYVEEPHLVDLIPVLRKFDISAGLVEAVRGEAGKVEGGGNKRGG